MSNLPKITESFEILVLGGRLSSWITARLLSQSGYKVGLIQREEVPGQEYKILPTPHGQLAQGLRLLPATAELDTTLADLSELLGTELTLQSLSPGVQTLDGTKRKSFVGFGEEAPDSLPLLESYLAAELKYLSSLQLAEIFRLCEGGFQTFSPAEVTHLEQQKDGWTVELNYQKVYWADAVFYSDSPGQLFELLRKPGKKPAKSERQLTKWKGWTSLNLTLIHRPAEEDQAPWILTSNKQEPTLGVFEEATVEHQVSHWLTFLDSDLAASEEACAAAYKEMRRQIKKIQPDLEILWEKIAIHPHSHGTPPLANQQLELGKGLFLMGPAFAPSTHPLWAELVTARKAFRSHQEATAKGAAAEPPTSEIHP